MADSLIELFAEELDLNSSVLNEESSPDNTEEWDSLASMRLVAAIEETYSVRLSTTEIMKMQTIGIARQVLRQKGAQV
jgi:acyl carrier protein